MIQSGLMFPPVVRTDMAACPHVSRDIKDCDRGCPESCDLSKMREAFVKANGQAQRCASQGRRNPVDFKNTYPAAGRALTMPA